MRVHCVVSDGELMVVPLQPPLHPVSHGPVVSSPFGSAHLLGLTCDHFVFIHDSSLQLWDAKYYICQDRIMIDCGANAKVPGSRFLGVGPGVPPPPCSWSDCDCCFSGRYGV